MAVLVESEAMPPIGASQKLGSCGSFLLQDEGHAPGAARWARWWPKRLGGRFEDGRISLLEI